MSKSDHRVTTNPPVPPIGKKEPEKKEPDSMPRSTSDPLDAAALLWGLRLWFVCALVIVACAVANYLLNWFAR